MGSALVSQTSRTLLGLIGSRRLERYVRQYGALDHSDLGTRGGINMLDSSGNSWQYAVLRLIFL